MQKHELLLSQTILLQELDPIDIQLYIEKRLFKIESYKKNTVIHFENCFSLKKYILL